MGLVLAALSGLLFWSGFAPLELWTTPPLGALALYLALQDDSLKKRVIRSSLSGVFFFAPLLHWSGIFIGAEAWIALTILQVALFSLIALAPRTPIAFAAAFTLIELLRMKFPWGGFGWGRLGFTQVEPLGFLYPSLGVTGISLLIIALPLMALVHRYRVLITLVPILALGAIMSSANPIGDIRIAAVQGGRIEGAQSLLPAARQVFERHIEVSSSIEEDFDLAIWPENSVGIDPQQDMATKRAIETIARQLNRPILVGAVQRSADGPRNMALLYGAEGNLISAYQKQDLVPFGEYIPLRSLVERLSPLATRVIDFQPGSDWELHRLDEARFAAVICFEVLDDDLIKGVSKANFLALLTNNATFGQSPQASQQLQIASARAAELGREFAVVSTIGHTAKIDNRGSITERLPQFAPGVLTMDIELHEERTLASKFTTWGWTIVLIALIIATRRSSLRR